MARWRRPRAPETGVQQRSVPDKVPPGASVRHEEEMEMRKQAIGSVRRIMATLSIAALGALGACGDDDASTDTSTTATDTAVATETTTATDTAGETTTDKVTWDEIAGIFRDSCTPCHSTGGSGGHNIAAPDLATSYAQSQKAVSNFAPAACAGKKVGECAHIRIVAGSMPAGAGCADDRTQAVCPTQAEMDLIQDWIDDGMLGPE